MNIILIILTIIILGFLLLGGVEIKFTRNGKKYYIVYNSPYHKLEAFTKSKKIPFFIYKVEKDEKSV